MSSSKATGRNTSSNEETLATGASPSSTNANTPNDTTVHSSQTIHSTARHTHDCGEPASADGARRKSTDSELMTWAHLSVDRSGARIRTICTRDHEDGETCWHTVREHRYRNIPRVDGPSEKITVEGVEAMMERDRKVERESEGEGEEDWVVVGKD